MLHHGRDATNRGAPRRSSRTRSRARGPPTPPYAPASCVGRSGGPPARAPSTTGLTRPVWSEPSRDDSPGAGSRPHGGRGRRRWSSPGAGHGARLRPRWSCGKGRTSLFPTTRSTAVTGRVPGAQRAPTIRRVTGPTTRVEHIDANAPLPVARVRGRISIGGPPVVQPSLHACIRPGDSASTGPSQWTTSSSERV